MTIPTFVQVLCEDTQQWVFLRRFFLKRGIPAQKIRSNISPSGRGAGCKYVIDNLPKEVRWYRSNANKLRCCLVVAIDSDVSETVQKRKSEIEKALTDAGESMIDRTERVALLVPRRNVETWICFLLGQEVNEEAEYRHFEKESACFPAVDKISPKRSLGCDSLIPSLAAGKEEIEKLFT